jgi:hypothetical protein
MVSSVGVGDAMAENTSTSDPKQESGTRAGALEDSLSQAVSALKVKVCTTCGTVVSGKKRYRDGNKYWCEACWALDSRRLQAGRFASKAAKDSKKRIRMKQMLILAGLAAGVGGAWLAIHFLT